MINRTIFLIPIFSMIFTLAAFSEDNGSFFPSYRNLTGDEPVQNAISSSTVKSGITDSPGEIVGFTQHEYQTNGSTGNRCVIDSEGGVHFVWTKASGDNFPPPQRGVYYNYLDPDLNWLAPWEGVEVAAYNGSGFGQISITSDNYVGVVYHLSSYDYVVYAQDVFPGMGIFAHHNPPDMLSDRCIWPYLAIDINNNIHIVMRENRLHDDFGAIGYTRSVNGGDTWSNLVAVDTIYAISQTITASPVSGKVAIVYTHPAFYTYDLRNDVYYIESENGIDWDWENGKVNATEYGEGEDSLFAYTDLAPIYDYNDNLHIIWNAWHVTDTGVGDSSYLYHYDYNSGITFLVNSVEFPQDSDCESGAWSQAICKMSLGVHEESGGIFTAYTLFDTSDCSAGGYANGEVYMQYSSNDGLNWSEPENLTDSPTPGCDAGNCDSDVWPSLADRVDDDLHIMYIDDKDAGGVPQYEGVVTENPVLYLAVPNPLLSLPESADIIGHVSVGGRGLFGIPIDLADSNGALIASTACDETGFYRFEEVFNGEYSVSISTPLGYSAEEEWQAVFMEGADVTIDFELTAVDIVDDRRGVGFWKHQLAVYLFDRGHPQIPEEEFRAYLGDINIHFNNNPINPVELYVVDPPGTPTDSLEAA
ncbi:MAG: SdrD B-like domain-containing protein, partial [candidate division Zixibacteria bacterium]